MSVTMKYSKSTKGTHVYICEDNAGFISTLYIKRKTFPSDPPPEITVDIDYSDD